MRLFIAVRFILFVVLACLATSGCGGKGRPAGWGGHVVDWSETTQGAEAVPGIDVASVHFGVCGDGYALVVWSDRGGSFGANWDQSHNAIKYEGLLRSTDGREYTVECSTSDGKTGSVTIDRQPFKLDDGALFLIATDGDKTSVKQLHRTSLKPEMDALREVAMTDLEIKTFFEGARIRHKR